MDPFVALATAASVTKSIKLCTGICLIIQRDVIQLAKETATLDQLSNGRLILGIGAGWNAEEMADHGTEYKTRMSLMADVSGESNPIAGSERERCVVYSQSCMLPHKLVCERAHTAATDKTPIKH